MIPAEFAAALNACKEPDWVLLGIVADWLDEHGDPMAASLRWAVRERKWPLMGTIAPDRFRCAWYDQSMVWSFPSDNSRLPRRLCDRWANIGLYNTIADAFLDLHQMLVKSGTLTTA